MAHTPEPILWLSLIDVSGPFLAGTVLEEAFPQGLEKIETPRRQRLRAAYEEWRDAIDEEDPQLKALHHAWVRMVLEDALEYDHESLASLEQLAGSILYRSLDGVEYSPDFVVRSEKGEPRLLIAVYPHETNLENPLPDEAWIASPAERMTLLCRSNECRVGLVTNGEEWMLVNAPVGETSGYASWFARLWWQEPTTLKAFVSLFGVRRCFGPEADRLPKLLERSLEFQEEVTTTLGEQVRRAVEVLVQSLGRADHDRNGELLNDVKPSELYEAGLTVMMRLVFILSAEERGLLLLGDQLYDQHYSVSALRAKLREDADHYGVEVLERRHDAWSRLLATFRSIFGGIEHEALRLPALGGSLFDPDRFPFLEGRASKTKWRDEPAVPLPIDNRTVLLLMTALQVLEQRGGAQLLSYRALDVEQIGHVYEGLLEFTAARVPEVTIGLLGTKKLPNPQITLSELESHGKKGSESLIVHLNEITGRSVPALRKLLQVEASRDRLIRLIQAANGDEKLAKRLIPFGDIIRADSWKNLLVYREGSFAIVKGTDRRSSGTHYTPRTLTEPIVRYTLEPLVYNGPAEGHPREEWKLKPSADILQLKVCDMACGSGAFLVEACRYLSLRLVEAWSNEEANGLHIDINGDAQESLGDHEPLPKSQDDRLLVARRLVAQSCLYGVDINHLAVELAKLSIWLVTLAKNKPFSFLDHALRCGDSLVGLHNIEQLRHYNLKPDADDAVLFKGPLEIAVDDAVELRLKLEEMSSNTVNDVHRQEELLDEAEEKITRLRCAADLLVSAHFWGENSADKKERIRQAAIRTTYFLDNGPKEDFQRDAFKERRGQKMFHWPLEFPEVIVTRGGFDAFVGNPPFMGGSKITGSLGTAFREFIVDHLGSGKRGSADLCTYFLLNAVNLTRSTGCDGFITTNTIAQGDTREVGMDQIVVNARILRAVSSQPWPGSASLEVSLVWFRKGSWSGSYFLDSLSVPGITAYLTPPSSVTGNPYRLSANAGKSFNGIKPYGMGFILTCEQAARLIAKNPRNSDVLTPYLIGDDFNSSPTQSPSRWVINFFDWSLEKASEYSECFDIVERTVRPERMSLKDNPDGKRLKNKWWLFGRSRPELYSTISTLKRVIVFAQTSKTKYPAFSDTRIAFDQKTIVIAMENYSEFAVLCSHIHYHWVVLYGSSLRTDPVYTPSDCFETFPFPAESAALNSVGESYHVHRRNTMLSRQEGLTGTYNRFHDSDESSSDIRTLRKLHIEMDEAVAAAYGWNDLALGHGFHETKQGTRYTINESARREVLVRLLKLNHERHEEELKQGSQEKKKKKTRVGKNDKQTDMFDGEQV